MTAEDITLIYSFTAYALKVSGDYQNAQDIIQDIFLRILNNPEKFESLSYDGKRNYIARAIVNQQKDRERMAVSKGKVKYHVPAEDSDAATLPDVYAKIELKDVLKKGLGHKHFPLLMLSAEGYSSYEIAEAKNMPLNTVLGSFRYARNFLNKE